MYNEMSDDIKSRTKDLNLKKRPLWGKAVKALLVEKSTTEKPLKVEWLAQQSGLNPKHLHNIIGGRVQDPPWEKLIRIADAFQISYTEFFERAIGEHEGAFYTCKYGERAYIDYSQHGFAIQSLSPPGMSGRDFFFGVMTIKPLKELKHWKFRENSMVAVYVEAGTLEITHGRAVRTLRANEAAYFDGGVSHKLRNVDSIEARLFIVTRPPIF
ncbi:MAG: XRE family transcriptional regulator [Candidatus Omnitrophica bacterium]|nr:XRE family transcriptional regulator [Candidatus Omnitrophota bacterium]